MVYTKHNFIPIYDCYFTIILSNSWGESFKKHPLLKERMEVWIDDDTPYAHCVDANRMVGKERHRCIYVMLNPWGHRNITTGTIAHESVHVKNYIWEQIKHVQDQKQDEPEAYLVDYIVTLVDGFIRKTEEQIRKDYDNESITKDTKAN